MTPAQTIGIGTRVSYEDMANPLREGVIVGEVAGQWLVLFDDVEGMNDWTDGEIDGVAFHSTVTKHMLEVAAERQQAASDERRGRLGGWNVEPSEAVTWIDQPVVGSHVRVRTVGPTWESMSSGTYLGVLRSEDDGQPMHYFIDGEDQRPRAELVRVPRPGGEPPVTDERTPTDAIRASHGIPEHDCDDHAVPHVSDGPLGHGWECGLCGAFLQAG